MIKSVRQYIAFLIIMLTANLSKADYPTMNITAINFNYTDSIGTGGVAYDAMTFDIYIEHTNVGSSGPFEFALGQYYFNVSSVIGVTADFNYYIVPGSTQFTNTNAVPRNPTFVSPDATSPLGASLRVNSNTVLGAGSGPIVSPSFPGTRVCTMRFKKKVGSTASFPLLNITWRTGLPNPFSKVFAYIGTVSTDLTSSLGLGTFIIDYSVLPVLPNIYLNNPPNNSIINPFIINFNWKKDNLSVAYVFQIFSDSLLTNNILNDTINNNIDTFKTAGGFSSNTKYYWRVGGKSSSGTIYFSSAWKFTTSPGITLNLKIIPEGLYYSLFNLLSRRDTISVYLRNSVSPYSKVDSSKAVIDSVNFTGAFTFPNAPSGTYYIAVKHLNSIETWSKAGGEPMTINSTSNYDFTTAAAQAYGNNLKLKGSKYCAYSGDINQDGIIDASDLIKIYNDSYVGLTGRYIVSDLNGDSIVDASDISTADNNVYNGVMKITP